MRRRSRRARCQFQGPNCEGDFIKIVPTKKYCDACQVPAIQARTKAYRDSKPKEYLDTRNRRRALMAAAKNKKA